MLENSLAGALVHLCAEGEEADKLMLMSEHLLAGAPDHFASAELAAPALAAELFRRWPASMAPAAACLVAAGVGGRTDLHTDLCDWTGRNLLLAGRKRWRLVPPSAAAATALAGSVADDAVLPAPQPLWLPSSQRISVPVDPMADQTAVQVGCAYRWKSDMDLFEDALTDKLPAPGEAMHADSAFKHGLWHRAHRILLLAVLLFLCRVAFAGFIVAA